MGKQKDLTEEEKRNTVQCLAQCKKAVKISKALCRDRRNVNSNKARRRSDEGVSQKLMKMAITHNQRRRWSPEHLHVAFSSRLPKLFSRARLSLIKGDKIQRIEFVKLNMKTNFRTVLLRVGARATLDGTDG